MAFIFLFSLIVATCIHESLLKRNEDLKKEIEKLHRYFFIISLFLMTIACNAAALEVVQDEDATECPPIPFISLTPTNVIVMYLFTSLIIHIYLNQDVQRGSKDSP
ncbi:hypothetical protein GCK72_022844 [Caenorhabditis remanei]|uniref:Transmembrane protein n=1 Tax=Caenorhabditis remanei TaxID=31234 RepID=A0A6A5FUT1_CAERE|nr:hypothetical protein GCK72_022844 [Caenorhabditis remanei]KAF1746390.1 hypothetical protein GCK72_022844 [Caenorhabditis remanei]